MDSKKVLEKLVKIAENQQKIINKMAQEMGMVPPGQGGATPLGGASDSWDVSAEVSGVLSQIPEAAKAKAGVQSASFGGQSGFLNVKVKFPSVNSMNDPNASAALNKLRETLKNKKFNDPKEPMKQVAVQQTNVVGVYG